MESDSFRHATGAPQQLRINVVVPLCIRLIRAIRGCITPTSVSEVGLNSQIQYRTTDRTDRTDTLGLMAERGALQITKRRRRSVSIVARNGGTAAIANQNQYLPAYPSNPRNP